MASIQTYTIAGIFCHVHGIEEVPENTTEIAILWLLHPRLQKAESMGQIGSQAIRECNTRAKSKGKRKALIAVSFDQRNHGSRLVDKLANEAWKQGNPKHAQDMFSIYQGTAHDTSLLIRHIGSYLPAKISSLPTSHHALGISLGGHSAWHLAMFEPRIKTSIPIIGCPDFTRLMLQRAEKSKLSSFQSGGASAVLSGTDFPMALVEEIKASDPAGVLLPDYMQAPRPASGLRQADHESSRRKLDLTLKGKKIFALSGGKDKLVPHSCGKVFYDFLSDATETWWRDGGCVFRETIYDGVGHEVTPQMADDAVRFLAEAIETEQLPADKARL